MSGYREDDWSTFGPPAEPSTRHRLTGDLVEQGHVRPARCGHCGSRTDEMVTHVTDEQLRGRGDWSWQCQGCGGIESLSRASVLARWRRRNEDW